MQSSHNRQLNGHNYAFLKNALANNDNNFKNLFSKQWGHSRSWLSFSCKHDIVYYLKFIVRAESLRDYVDGWLSLAYIPNIVAVDMARVLVNHATRKDDAKYYGKGGKEGNIFNPFIIHNNLHVHFPRIFKQEQQKKETFTEINTHSVTGCDVHLCLFDKFHERNTISKIEALRRVRNITELIAKFNSEN